MRSCDWTETICRVCLFRKSIPRACGRLTRCSLRGSVRAKCPSISQWEPASPSRFMSSLCRRSEASGSAKQSCLLLSNLLREIPPVNAQVQRLTRKLAFHDPAIGEQVLAACAQLPGGAVPHRDLEQHVMWRRLPDQGCMQDHCIQGHIV